LKKPAYSNIKVNIIFRREFEEFSLKKVLILIIFLEFSVIIRNYLIDEIKSHWYPQFLKKVISETLDPLLIFCR